jgi:hypothetical protein
MASVAEPGSNVHSAPEALLGAPSLRSVELDLRDGHALASEAAPGQAVQVAALAALAHRLVNGGSDSDIPARELVQGTKIAAVGRS